jgi:hypothetical protein
MLDSPDAHLWKEAIFPFCGFFWTNYTKNQVNVDARATDLRAYLEKVLNLPREGRILRSETLLTILAIGPHSL